jgi:hypothetical protein
VSPASKAAPTRSMMIGIASFVQETASSSGGPSGLVPPG